MNTEFQLLLLCARRSLSARQGTQLRALAAKVPDWDRLLQMAAQHNLLSLLQRHMKQHAAELLPPGIAADLKERCLHGGARNLLLAHTLESLLDRFNKAGVDAIPVKGPTLALRAYGELAARRFGDLDILIRRGDLPAAFSCLERAGFCPALTLDTAQLSAYARHEDDLAFVNPAGVLVELHWELSGLYLARPLAFDALPTAPESIELLQREVRVLPEPVLLVYLAVHGSKHIWQRLEWLASLHQVAESLRRQDWDEALELAERWQCRGMLLLGSTLCRELLGTELPLPVQDAIAARPQLEKLSRRVVHMLTEGRPDDPTGDLAPRFSLFHLQVRDSFCDQVRYLLRMGFRPSSSEWEIWAPPAVFAPLLYLLRPVRLLVLGWQGVFGNRPAS